jgi:hypothetical protein
LILCWKCACYLKREKRVLYQEPILNTCIGMSISNWRTIPSMAVIFR